MSVMEQNPLDSIIGPDFVPDLERRIALAKAFVTWAEGMLQRIQQKSVAAAVSADPQRYAAFKPGKGAILNACRLMFTIFPRPMTEDEIVKELLSGGIVTGGKKQTDHQKAHNIRQALSAYVTAKDMQLINGKYGLPGWGKERF